MATGSAAIQDVLQANRDGSARREGASRRSGGKRPRVLFVGVGAPWRRDAGYLQRQDMFLQALADIADLTIAVFDRTPDDLTPRYCNEVIGLPLPQPAPESKWRSLWNDVISPLPMLYRRLDFSGPRTIIDSLNPQTYDAVFAYRIDFACYTGVLDHPRLMLDIDDPEHLRRRERMTHHHASLRDWYMRVDVTRLRRFERDSVRRAAVAYVCQRNDQQAFGHPRPVIVPNCVEVPAVCPQRQPKGLRVLFVGDLNRSTKSPNSDAVMWFAQEVWPRVRQQHPSAEFHVVGKVWHKIRERLEAAGGTVVHGFVDDVRPAYADATMSIAPIRYGTGTRVKIIESIALGCPVVSTTKGFEGIELAPERDLLVGDDADAFAGQCARLLSDPSLQRRLTQSAHAQALEKYDRVHRHGGLTNVLRDGLRVAMQRGRSSEPALAAAS